MSQRSVLNGVVFYALSEENQRWFKRPFLEEEVKTALNSLEDDKAPGPDEFPIKFLKVCWDVLGKDVMATFATFHSHNQWCQSLSATFISLIPKKKGPT